MYAWVCVYGELYMCHVCVGVGTCVCMYISEDDVAILQALTTF